MSKRASDFIDEWMSANAENMPQAPSPSEAQAQAAKFLAAAQQKGISRAEIEEEIGDVVAFMSGTDEGPDGPGR